MPRSRPNAAERALLAKLRRGAWTRAELTWLAAHLPPDTDT
jgi:hypothetical protein